MKKQNILSKLWYSILIIPGFLFVSTYIWDNAMDRFVFDWIIILGTSLLLQLVLFTGVPYRVKVVHILYIVFAVVLSMFISYFIHKYLSFDKMPYNWLNGDNYQ